MKEKENKYLRVGTTLYKIVKRPLMSGDFIEERRPWNYETLRQDHSKDFISTIEKFDGFCSVPSHVDYQRSIGKFLNQYEPIHYQPKEGEYLITVEFLTHIFGEQLEMGVTEIPHFLFYLQHRDLSTKSESRMWFRHDLLVTPDNTTRYRWNETMTIKAINLADFVYMRGLYLSISFIIYRNKKM